MRLALTKTLCAVLPLAGLLMLPPGVSAHDRDRYEYRHDLKRAHREFHRDLRRSHREFRRDRRDAHREFHRNLREARRDYYRDRSDDCRWRGYPFSYRSRSDDSRYFPWRPFYSGSPWWYNRWWYR
ncbi:MAG: hypothetical protein NZ578_02685 [Candidatus Binatia bacterium]|nr:hypothetical protein [Candidatus Binatia bacterium]